MSDTQTFDFSELEKKWPSALVARTDVGPFSGGVLHPRTMANVDSLGQGPPSVRIGRSVAYPVRPLIEWMRKRSERG